MCVSDLFHKVYNYVYKACIWNIYSHRVLNLYLYIFYYISRTMDNYQLIKNLLISHFRSFYDILMDDPSLIFCDNRPLHRRVTLTLQRMKCPRNFYLMLNKMLRRGKPKTRTFAKDIFDKIDEAQDADYQSAA